MSRSIQEIIVHSLKQETSVLLASQAAKAAAILLLNYSCPPTAIHKGFYRLANLLLHYHSKICTPRKRHHSNVHCLVTRASHALINNTHGSNKSMDTMQNVLQLG